MSKKQMTLIYYYVPQDQDDPDTPNVFGVTVSKNNIRLQHLYDNFPLKGSYIFRFKVMYDNSIAWLDLPELDTKLPTFKDKIYVKATRVSWQTNKENPYGHYRFVKKSQTQSQQASTKNPTNANANVKKQTVPTKSSPAPKTESVKNNEMDLDLLGESHETGSVKKSENTTNIDINLNDDLI